MDWIKLIFYTCAVWLVLGKLWGISTSLSFWWIGLPLVIAFGYLNAVSLQWVGLEGFWIIFACAITLITLLSSGTYLLQHQKMMRIIGNDINRVFEEGRFHEIPTASRPLAMMMLSQAIEDPSTESTFKLLGMYTNTLIVISIVAYIASYLFFASGMYA